MFKEIDNNDEFLSKVVILIFRFGNFSYYRFSWPFFRQILIAIYRILDLLIVRLALGSEISGKIKCGKNLKIYHPFGIIINPKVTIGDNVTLRHQVTIGNDGIDDQVPRIGSNIQIGAGAKIIGGIEVKSGSIIGANAVVNKNFPKPGLLVGVPAIQKKEY
jgi:serine acetyltransferase